MLFYSAVSFSIQFIYAFPVGDFKMYEQDKSVSNYAIIVFILVAIFFVVSCTRV